MKRLPALLLVTTLALTLGLVGAQDDTSPETEPELGAAKVTVTFPPITVHRADGDLETFAVAEVSVLLEINDVVSVATGASAVFVFGDTTLAIGEHAIVGLDSIGEEGAKITVNDLPMGVAPATDAAVSFQGGQVTIDVNSGALDIVGPTDDNPGAPAAVTLKTTREGATITAIGGRVTVVDARGTRTEVDKDGSASLTIKGGRFDVLMAQGSSFNVTTGFELVVDEPDELPAEDEPLEELAGEGGLSTPGLPRGNPLPPDSGVPGTNPGANTLSTGLP
jgi:hypothetical protein